VPIAPASRCVRRPALVDRSWLSTVTFIARASPPPR
jgi:hypothetical protein